MGGRGGGGGGGVEGRGTTEFNNRERETKNGPCAAAALKGQSFGSASHDTQRWSLSHRQSFPWCGDGRERRAKENVHENEAEIKSVLQRGLVMLNQGVPKGHNIAPRDA